jgi:broad specificity phosphatase PhoE
VPIRPHRLAIVFETHATSLDNEAGLASGWYDVDLSDRGEEQARLLGVRRRDDRVDLVFCSDLRRAYRTAELAFGERPPLIVRDPRLRECDYGEWTRRPAGEIDSRRGGHVSRPFPGGESYEQVVARVRDWLREVGASHPGRRLLVIGHRATFYALEHLLRRQPLRRVVEAPWKWQPGWKYPR